MDVDGWLETFGLDVDASQLDCVRSTLADAIRIESANQGEADTELMRLCCFQLFRVAQLEDVLLIWAAKTSSMDADASIDVQLLCGAGLERTKEYLSTSNCREAAEALARIRASEGAGDFDGFSVEDFKEQLGSYFGEAT